MGVLNDHKQYYVVRVSQKFIYRMYLKWRDKQTVSSTHQTNKKNFK